MCKDQGSEEWYNELIEETNFNVTKVLPIASMKKISDVSDIPIRIEGAPSIQFMQSEGTCGLSSFSSAFYEYFDKFIANEWMKQTKSYSIGHTCVISSPMTERVVQTTCANNIP